MSEKLTLTIWQTAALKCLEHAVRRDAEKGGDGSRTTVEVAEYVGITAAQARKLLYSLADADLVDVFDTTPLDWQITEAGKVAFSATVSS